MRLTEVKTYAKPNHSLINVEIQDSVLTLNPIWFIGASVIFAPDSWSNGLTQIETMKGTYIVREKPDEIFDLVKALIKEMAEA